VTADFIAQIDADGLVLHIWFMLAKAFSWLVLLCALSGAFHSLGLSR
jgi:hypothetical protein